MSRQIRVGLLVFAGLLLFLLSLFAIGTRTFLFADTFVVNAEYESVAGLQPGASVQFQGVRVGRVETVSLPEERGQKINVTMAIRSDAQHLIHQNTQAQIKTDGLVGNQIVVLVNPPGVPVAEVESGDRIQGVEPFDLFEITDDARGAALQFEATAAEMQQIVADIRAGEGSLGRFIYDPALYNSAVQTTNETRVLMRQLGEDARTVTQLAEEATRDVQSILAKVDEGEGTLAQLVNDPRVYDTFLATADTLQGISMDLRAVTTSAENAVNWGALGAFRFSELMHAAKHNFLFRRYFEERGYMERAPFEVRERAIEQTYQDLEATRRELQAWQDRLEARESALQNYEAPAPVGESEDTVDVQEESETQPPGIRASQNTESGVSTPIDDLPLDESFYRDRPYSASSPHCHGRSC